MAYWDDKLANDPQWRDSIQASARQNRVDYYRRRSEIGERFAERTFANYRANAGNNAALGAAKKAAEDLSGLYLYGEPGNGKTHLAAAIVNECIERCIPSVFTTSVGLISRIKDSYKSKGESERNILSHYARVEVLVLDDLGTEDFTANTSRLFYSLINERYEANLPLIVTANVSLADLVNQWKKSGVEEHIGKKLGDRLFEMCKPFVRISAPSQRGVA